jgi:hypothetical protein
MTARVRILALLLLLPLLACDDNGRSGVRDPPTAPTPPPAPAGLLRVDFRVTGSIRQAHITYLSSTTGTTQLTTDLPWVITYQTAEPHPFVYLAAETTLENLADGTLVVQIFVNGVLFREARATGFSLSVVASGDVP